MIDIEQVFELARIQCTDDEIARVLKICKKTFQRAKARADVAEALECGRMSGRASLRRMQLKAAEEGNATMLIWLGKQWLDQKDVNRQEHTGKDGGPIETKDVTAEEFAKLPASERARVYKEALSRPADDETVH